MPNPRKQERELDALYATLPTLACKGYCHDSCGPIDMSVRERARIVERARKPITCGLGASCSMLTAERRCSVYDIRPMICRLWGLTKGMRCPYGCVPERWLPDDECARLLVDADRIGGSPKGDRAVRMMQTMLDSMTEDELSRMLRKVGVFRAGRPTLDGRAGALAHVDSPIFKAHASTGEE